MAQHPKNFSMLNAEPVKIAYRFAVLRNWYAGPVYRRLEAARGINEVESSILFFLGRADGSRAQDICDIVGRPKTTISRGVNSLLRKKLIKRFPDETDKRQRLIFLTPEGRREYESQWPQFAEQEAKLVATLSAPELAFLDAVLAKLIDNLPAWVRSY